MNANLLRPLLVSAAAVVAIALTACGAPDDANGESDLKGTAPSVGKTTKEALSKLAAGVTLGFLGEDSGEFCTATLRYGPVEEFSQEKVLSTFGFNPSLHVDKDGFAFSTVDPSDQEFWDTFIDSQDGDDGAQAAKDVADLLSQNDDVLDLATMVVDDDRSFEATAFLVARMSDKSLVALRGDIGGMSF